MEMLILQVYNTTKKFYDCGLKSRLSEVLKIPEDDITINETDEYDVLNITTNAGFSTCHVIRLISNLIPKFNDTILQFIYDEEIEAVSWMSFTIRNIYTFNNSKCVNVTEMKIHGLMSLEIKRKEYNKAAALYFMLTEIFCKKVDMISKVMVSIDISAYERFLQ